MNQGRLNGDIPPAQQLGRRTRSGAVWAFLSQGISTALMMLCSIILARLLTPGDFGIVAMAMVVTGLMSIFRDLGIGQSLVQREQIEKRHIASAYWGTLLLGAGLCLATIALAPLVGTIFHEPRMSPVLQLMALTFVIAPLGTIPTSLLQRQLDFRRPFYASLVGSLAYAVVGIGMTYLGYGYWSLAWAQIASTAGTAVAICIITRHLPPLVPSLDGLQDLYRFGLGMTGVGFFNYLAQQVDNFIVGRWMDGTALGFYSRAFSLVHSPLGLFTGTMSVLFPAFAQIQNDHARLRDIFGRVLTTVSVFSVPALALLAATAPQLIPLLLGPQWHQSIVPVQILSLSGILRTLINPGAMLLRGLGRVYSQLWQNVVYAVALATGAGIGLHWGIVGVSVGVVLANLLNWMIQGWLVRVYTGFGALDYIRSLRGALLCASACALTTVLIRWKLEAGHQPAITIFCMSLTPGLLVCLLLTLLSPCTEYRTAWRSVLALRGR